MNTPASSGPLHLLVIHPMAQRIRDALLAVYPQLRIAARLPGEALDDEAWRAQVLVGLARDLPNGRMQNFTQLRWIQALTSGVDGYLALKGLSPTVLITSVRGIHGPAVSEHVLLHMLMLSRDYPQLQAQHAQQRWNRVRQPLLNGKTVVIVGTGVIACALAQRCRAMGMHCVGVSTQAREIAEFDQVFSRMQMKQALALGDFVVLLVPLDDSTRGLIGAAELQAMKGSAYLVNVSRGGVCDEPALLAALQGHRLAGAAIDVFAVEPLPKDDPLWTAPRTLITPHIAGESDDYLQQVLPILQENLGLFLQGRAMDMRNLQPRKP